MLHKKKKKIKNKKEKRKNKKSIFQTIEVLNDLSKLKSDFSIPFYVKNKNKKKLTFLCFSACFINMVLQYLRQLHNLSSFLS